MRVISNALVNLTTEKNMSPNTKENAQASGKLLALLQGSKNNEVILEAALKGLVEGKAKLWISGIGNIEVNLPANTQLPDSSNVNVKFALQNDTLLATIMTEDQTEVPQKLSKTEDLISQLKQLGIPQTEQNIKAVKLLNEYHIEPSAERIKQLAEGSFLASKANQIMDEDSFSNPLGMKDQKVDLSRTLKGLVIDWLSQHGEEKLVNTEENALTDSGEKALSAKPQTISLAQTEEKGIKTQISTTLENILAEESADSNLNTSKDSKINSAVLSELQNTDEELRNLKMEQSKLDNTQLLSELKDLLKGLGPKQLLPLIASDSPLNLENILLSDQVFSGSKNIGELKQVLIDKLKEVFSQLEPSKAMIQEIIEWVEEDPAALTFKNQLEQLETIIARHSPEAALEMKESFEQINKAMNFVDQMQNQVLAFHVPIQFGDHDTQVELYMKKRNGRQSQDEFKMFLALNTHTMGQVQVLITDQKTSVELQFRLETDNLTEIFKDQESQLHEALDIYSDKPVKLKFVTHSNEPALLEAFKVLKDEMTTSIDMRV